MVEVRSVSDEIEEGDVILGSSTPPLCGWSRDRCLAETRVQINRPKSYSECFFFSSLQIREWN